MRTKAKWIHLMESEDEDFRYEIPLEAVDVQRDQPFTPEVAWGREGGIVTTTH